MYEDQYVLERHMDLLCKQPNLAILVYHLFKESVPTQSAIIMVMVDLGEPASRCIVPKVIRVYMIVAMVVSMRLHGSS
jgi:hypothetical protein